MGGHNRLTPLNRACGRGGIFHDQKLETKHSKHRPQRYWTEDLGHLRTQDLGRMPIRKPAKVINGIAGDFHFYRAIAQRGD
jgi:hypothetical protein